MQNAGTKSILGIISGVFGYLFNCFNEMIVILVILAVLDYFLGIAAAMKQGEVFNTEKAIWGAFKKVLYAVVILLAYLGDFLIIYAAKYFGITIPVNSMLGVAAGLYLIGTEGFSNCKNLALIGIPMPGFLLKFFGLIIDQSGKVVPIPETEEKTGGES